MHCTTNLVAVVLLSRDTNVWREETTCRIPAYMVAALKILMSGERRLHVGFLLTWLLYYKLVAVVLLINEKSLKSQT